MTEIITGGCYCGATRYQFTDRPKIRAQCYCRDCQYFYAGGPQTLIIVNQATFSLTQGTTRTFTLKSEAGNKVIKHFCNTCFTPIYSEIVEPPDSLVISAGSLDDPNAFPPKSSIWTKSAPNWAAINPDLPKFH